MAVISADQPVVTMVNSFEVAPENQQRLVDILVLATTSVMHQVPGFVSANIHASLDGTRVLNYAQWRSVEDIKAMLANPAAHAHFAEVRAIAKPERGIYQLRFTQDASGAATARPVATTAVD